MPCCGWWLHAQMLVLFVQFVLCNVSRNSHLHSKTWILKYAAAEMQEEEHPCPWQGGWNYIIFKVPPAQAILWFCDWKRWGRKKTNERTNKYLIAASEFIGSWDRSSWKGLVVFIWSNFVLTVGSALRSDHVIQGFMHLDFENLQEWRLHNSSGQLV